MAIQPIDLSTMYSQMNNVAKTVAHQQQGSQLTHAMQEASRVQQNSETAAQVHKTAGNEAKSTQVKDDSNGSNGSAGGNSKKRQQNEEQETPKEQVIRESYLGTHIDISR